MIGYLRLELLRALRDRRYMALVLGWPVASYLLFSSVFGAPSDAAEGLPPQVEIMVAMATFGAMGAVLLATGPRMAADRHAGWLRHLQLTPLSAVQVLAVRVASAMVLTLPTILLTFAAAAAVKGVSLPAWEWPAMAALLLLGSLPFAGIGVLIGILLDDGAGGFSTIAYIVLAFLGGLFIPLKILPPAMRHIASALPSGRLAQLGWQVAGGHAPHVAAVAVLGAWLVGSVAAAVALSRRAGASAI